MHRYGDPEVSARFSFTGDPTRGDASIAVTALRGSDTATYQCKVKKAPGVDMRKVTLVVLGEGHFLSKLVLPVSFLTSSESGGGHALFGGHPPHCVSVMQSDAPSNSSPVHTQVLGGGTGGEGRSRVPPLQIPSGHHPHQLHLEPRERRRHAAHRHPE